MPVPDFSPGEVLTAAAMDSIGLWLVKTQTVGSGVASVSVTNAFSANYDNYLITLNGGVGSTADALRLQLTGSTTGYYAAWNGIIYSNGNANNGTDNGTASWTAGAHYTEGSALNATLFNPFLAVRTGVYFSRVDFRTTGASAVGSGFHNVSASYTGFTLIPGASTMTGGTIRVYGYRN